MEQTNTTPVLPAEPRRSASEARPAEAPGDGTLHPLESRRIDAGYDTPGDLATAANVARGTVVGIEQGTVANVRTSTARKLATALDVPLLVLIAELRNPRLGTNPAHPQRLIVGVDAEPIA